MRALKTRAILKMLGRLGMLIEYRSSLKFGEDVMINGIGRRNHIVNLGTAKAAALAAERDYWWGGAKA